MMSGSGGRENTGGIDRVTIRLAVFGIVIFAAFVALFSRLWFLQVLASDQYQGLAKENRVRKVSTEPQRGRILDANGKVLVDNRRSLTITVRQGVIDRPTQRKRVLSRLARLLEVPVGDLEGRVDDGTVSPYKPVAVANDVRELDVKYIQEHQEMFPGVESEELPLREYPFGALAPQILGYVNEISPDDLKSSHFKGVRPAYQAGDIVGKSGIEYEYDSTLRGTPGERRVIVNSSGDVVGKPVEVQDERPGKDVVLSLDVKVQRLAQDALKSGIDVSRGQGYQAPAGGVVVMDPHTGAVKAMASFPTYNPKIAEDGFTEKEYASLTRRTEENPDGGALFFRPIQAQKNPGSTMKGITAAAAMSTGVIGPYDYLPCPPTLYLPPDDPVRAIPFNNYTTLNMGTMSFPESLEVSCDTFYYQLGWDMQEAFGVTPHEGFTKESWEKAGDPKLGPDKERFQKYARLMGLGHPTGIDLPSETSGLVPDQRWCHEQYVITKADPKTYGDTPTCNLGWLPGYDVNMAIGQGDLLVDPLQMAVAYSAIANGGHVVQPRLVWSVGQPDSSGDEETLREFEPRVVNEMGLDETQLGVIHQGLEQVVSGGAGTARAAFAGFPLEQYPVAGKTGTAEIGETGLNDAWFISYAPADDPQYVVAVYIERSGHGGENAAPVARQIYEGLFGIDDETQVHVGDDNSG
jgi:penicillin-binding protein 2